jgi:hypothetical protein
MKRIVRTGPWPALVACLAVAACRSSDGSSENPKLSDPNDPVAVVAPATASQRGTSGAVVDWDGDGIADLVVGAPYAARADGGVGAVLVYRGTASGFEETPAYTLGAGDNFGAAMAVVGDADGDRKDDLAVAALNGDGPDASLCGNVIVFKGGSKGEVLARLSGEMAMDKFGASLTGRCDLDADGTPDLVVGATHHSAAPDVWLGGAVYVYFGPSYSQAARVKLPATETKGILGFASACGDLNGDGVDDLALSAIWTHGVIWSSSNVLVYYGKPGFAPTTDAPDVTIASTASHFGDALAILDDLNGDGYGELAIGVPALYALPAPTTANQNTSSPSLKGRVFVVKGGTGTRTVNLSPAPGTPIPDLLTTIYGGEYLERFGSAMATLGDLDQDGKPDLAVAALHGTVPGATTLDGGKVTGLVRVFLGKDLKADGTATQATAGRVLSRAQRSLHYGSFLAPFERGGPRLAVGAATANRQDGAVFVEDLTPPQAP